MTSCPPSISNGDYKEQGAINLCFVVFCGNYGSVMPTPELKIQKSLDSGDLPEAHRRVHASCGVVGNIGAHAVARRACDLELQILKDESETYIVALDLLGTELKLLSASMSHWTTEASPCRTTTHASPNTLDADAIEAKFTELE